jgi:cyclopropane fatty-acyl-phospholipid synthase-like methyltransferase
LAGIRPPAKLLELGGGAGWTAEFLAQFGFDVVSSTLSPHDASITRKRAETLRAKGFGPMLEAVVAPMETIAESVKAQRPFDAVFVFEALHHAFDWRSTVASSYECLSPGGWLLICNEPNFLHTAVSYRVAVLTNTHEVGFRKSDLLQHLKKTGFRRVISTGKRPHLYFRPHWLLAQK